MSEEKKSEDTKKKGTVNVSRRTFLKDAGFVVGAPAIGTIALSSDQASAQDKVSGAQSVGGSGISIIRTEAAATIGLTVNGDKYRLTVEPNWSLRQVIRDEIGLTSPKDWCGGLGACGSCTVIMNGRPVLSCLTLACECDGADIETAEGIAKSGHPIIQAYIDHNAFQCGYCTPGFVCTSKALLDKNSDPTEADARDALGGNLCRCATYQQHPPAVLQAARELKNT